MPLAAASDWPDLLPMLAIAVSALLLIRAVRWLVFRHRRVLHTERHVRGQLLLIAIGMTGLVCFLLALPVTETTRGKPLDLLGTLLTAVIALSAPTVVANALAGRMVRSMRSFRPGDFIRCGESFGRVTQRGIFFTEIQTEQRDLATLPNQYLISSLVTVVRASGTIVSAELSLGYDVDHVHVEELLARAAGEAGLSDPFVLVIELGNFAITYRVSGVLEEVSKLVSLRSRLRAKVLDVLHGAGVEIASPNFMNQPPPPTPPAPSSRRAKPSPVRSGADRGRSGSARPRQGRADATPRGARRGARAQDPRAERVRGVEARG